MSSVSDRAGQPGSSCSTDYAYRASDEAQLRAALATAHAGQVIAIEGTIPLTADLVIDAPSVTLTCATAGAGLAAMPGVVNLVDVRAAGVQLRRLVLDGTNASNATVHAMNAPDGQFTALSVQCPALQSALCLYFERNTPRTAVKNNFIASLGNIAGIHMQFGVDSSVVEGNTLVALGQPSGYSLGFGGIRVRDGVGVMIAGNAVSGPWARGISIANLLRGTIRENQLIGVQTWGIRSQQGGLLVPSISNVDILIAENRINGAGLSAIRLDAACGNRLVENRLDGNGGNIGIEFSTTTGANVVVLERRTAWIVIDNGASDCDGDGTVDPNVTVRDN